MYEVTVKKGRKIVERCYPLTEKAFTATMFTFQAKYNSDEYEIDFKPPAAKSASIRRTVLRQRTSS